MIIYNSNNETKRTNLLVDCRLPGRPNIPSTKYQHIWLQESRLSPRLHSRISEKARWCRLEGFLVAADHSKHSLDKFVLYKHCCSLIQTRNMFQLFTWPISYKPTQWLHADQCGIFGFGWSKTKPTNSWKSSPVKSIRF